MYNVYKNGNYIVTWNSNVMTKRACRVGEDLKADFPDSIDLKISNKCSWGCPFCHESSTPRGKVFDLDRTIQVLEQLPKVPIEVAIGGGNVLENPVETLKLIEWLGKRGNLTRVTVNRKDLDLEKLTREQRAVLEGVNAVGVSIDGTIEVFEDEFGDRSLKRQLFGMPTFFASSDEGKTSVSVYTAVAHIIAGIFPAEKLDYLFRVADIPVLILGYKQWGRAKDTELPESLEDFRDAIKQQIYKLRTRNYQSFYSMKTIGFDNLALEQLDIKSCLTDEEWGGFYLGPEGSHSMYIDAVEGTFARTSRSPERTSWNDVGLLDYFRSL